MELTLAHQTETEITVTCDGQHSHTFEVRTLLPNREKGLPHPLDDPMAYGIAVYLALFPPESLAHHGLETIPERILLVTTDNDLDAVPWEYAYGPDGFLVLECHFVRGLPAEQRIAPPTLDSGLHIVAVPSNPLSQEEEPLDIEGEWMRLKDIIEQVPFTITLERARPPTIEQVRTLVANQRQRVIHFMGHGGQDKQGAVLYFEQENGDLDPITARQFALRVRGTVFLVTLNACITATPGATTFSNLAGSLARQKTPYALGMRYSIPDEDARAFSRTFYSELAQGTSVEEALRQARLTLADSPRPWAIGVPVLYTSLEHPATGFSTVTGSPTIKEHQPHLEISLLPRAEGTFQGRFDELKQLGTLLTGNSRPPLVTIHGGGGQGKTALARETVERFAYAWPGGIWATSLDNLPNREMFVTELARFLGIDTQKVGDPGDVERLVTAQLAHRRTLIVLDNAETLVEAVEANNEEAVRLAQFLREQVPRPPVSLLATSRSFLGWTGEVGCELTGLAPLEGVRLFQQHTSQREKELDQELVWKLSEQVEGHPLSLRLLGSAFNASAISFSAFLREYEAHLLRAEDKYKDVDHRQRTLYASIETSARYLDVDQRALLSGLWIFRAPFLSETAATIFDPEHEDTEENPSPVHNHIYTLWQRGLLTRQIADVHDGALELYYLLPTTRPYVERYLEQVYERDSLLERFGAAYADLANFLFDELDRSAVAVAIAWQALEDLGRGVNDVAYIDQGYYLLHCGWILHRLGNPWDGLRLLEHSLEIAQGQDQLLELQALNNIALVHDDTGKPQEALKFYEQILPIWREVGDRAGEAATLNNVAGVYRMIGKPQEALKLYEQILPIRREINDRTGEATTLNNMALVYDAVGRPREALRLYEQALHIWREVGDRAGEATTLGNMAAVYHAIGKPQRALRLYQQALPIMREMRDRAGEATTFNNIALVYGAIGQLQEALKLYEQILPIRREINDRAGEATTLNNMALVYRKIGEPQEALRLYEQALLISQEVGSRSGESIALNNMAGACWAARRPREALRLYEQALPIMREVSDRAAEAATLNNMALVNAAIGQPQEALRLYEQALPIMREVDNRAGEATTLSSIAGLFYQLLNRPQDAINHMEVAITVLVETGLTRDAAGQTVESLRGILDNMRAGASIGTPPEGFSTIPTAQIKQIVANTITVITVQQDRRAEWREVIMEELKQARQQGVDWQIEADFFTAILAFLDGQLPTLPEEHPYAQAIAMIREGISEGELH
jgi:tetratricopeptide (TPR) repeat protein